jgi:hypothetical protein
LSSLSPGELGFIVLVSELGDGDGGVVVGATEGTELGFAEGALEGFICSAGSSVSGGVVVLGATEGGAALGLALGGILETVTGALLALVPATELSSLEAVPVLLGVAGILGGV